MKLYEISFLDACIIFCIVTGILIFLIADPRTSVIGIILLIVIIAGIVLYCNYSKSSVNPPPPNIAEKEIKKQEDETEDKSDINNAIEAKISVDLQLNSDLIGWNGYELKLPKIPWPPPNDTSKCVSCQQKKGKIKCCWCGDLVCNKCIIKLGVPTSTVNKALRIITGVVYEKFYAFCPRCYNYGKMNKLF